MVEKKTRFIYKVRKYSVDSYIVSCSISWAICGCSLLRNDKRY